MNNYLENNLEAIRNNHSEIKINEELVSKYETETEVEPITSYNGYSLCSSIDQQQAIEVWCEQFEEHKHNEVIFVYGIGHLDYYVRLNELYSDLTIVIYEPYEELLYNNLARGDYVELLSGDNICICVGERMRDTFTRSCEIFMNYESVAQPFFAQFPNYHKIFETEYKKYVDNIKSTLRSAAMSRNTLIGFEEDIINNYLEHLTGIYKESTIYELIEQFSDSDIGDYPAIILSAGPSLDKNINKIKDVKGRALIIAVDVTINTAILNGVIPDMIVCDDPYIQVVPFKDSTHENLREEVSLVIRTQGAVPIRDACKGRRFYAPEPREYLVGLLKEFNKEMPLISTGGSVANTAFSIAKLLGCKAIILMGQDLGYPDNKIHAKDAFEEDEEDASEDDDRFFYRESVDGGKVLTSNDMDAYREWFEFMIQADPDYDVIDATEGGALIHGTKVMTIEEAIDEYCPTERMDFEQLIKDTPYIAEGEERERLKDTIDKTFEDVDDNIKYLEGVKRDYYKLRDVNEKRRYDSKEFKRIIKKVGEHNERLDDDKDFILYRKCCNEKHYELIDSLRDVHDDTYDEIKNLVDHGLVMLDEYIRAGKLLKEKWNKLMKEKGHEN